MQPTEIAVTQPYVGHLTRRSNDPDGFDREGHEGFPAMNPAIFGSLPGVEQYRENGECHDDRPGAAEARRSPGRIGRRPGTMWFRMQGQRVWRRRVGLPLCWSEYYQRADAPRDALLSGRVFVERLAKQWVDQTISEALLEPHMADALDAEPYSAALVITRLHRDERGKATAAGIHTHPADRHTTTNRVGSGH